MISSGETAYSLPTNTEYTLAVPILQPRMRSLVLYNWAKIAPGVT